MRFEEEEIPICYEKVRVFVILTNGDPFFGWVWVTNERRLQDMLNDHRKFIPIERDLVLRGERTLNLINKSSIVLIEERQPNGNSKVLRDA